MEATTSTTRRAIKSLDAGFFCIWTVDMTRHETMKAL